MLWLHVTKLGNEQNTRKKSIVKRRIPNKTIEPFNIPSRGEWSVLLIWCVNERKHVLQHWSSDGAQYCGSGFMMNDLSSTFCEIILANRTDETLRCAGNTNIHISCSSLKFRNVSNSKINAKSPNPSVSGVAQTAMCRYADSACFRNNANLFPLI